MKQSLRAPLILSLVLVAGLVGYWQYVSLRAPVSREELVFMTGTGSSEEFTDGIQHTVPLDQIVSGGPPKDGIPSIDDPVFENVQEADIYLNDDGLGLAVEHDGDVRFYPYQILVWHEIVNDTFKGEPLLVTYCPLCFSGTVFERTVNGDILEFGTSGKLWNNNLVMYDRKSESLWSQTLGQAIVGEDAGTRLVHYPTVTMSWQNFRSAYPSGEVLSRDTGMVRDYTRDPYGNYHETQAIYFPLSRSDDRLPPKDLVFGIHVAEEEMAYPENLVKDLGLINDSLSGEDILVLHDTNLDVIRIFSRKQNKQTLTFTLDGEIVRDQETGSVWNFEGEAVSGPLKSSSLEVIVHLHSFWFSWAATWPETKIYTP